MSLDHSAETDSSDMALLAKIGAIESRIKVSCDMIPVANWGFSEGVQERMRQMKHHMVNKHLTAKEKATLSKSQKHQFARSLGGLCATVSEALDWMNTNEQGSVQPQKAPKNQQKPDSKAKTVKGNDTDSKKPAVVESSSGEDSDDEAAVPTSAQPTTPGKKPIATVKPVVRKDVNVPAVESDSSDDEHDDDDEDSDDEMEQVKSTGSGEKRKNDSSDSATPAKKTKLDKELEQFNNVDLSSLNPLEARKVAMLKLQKKIEDMKINRRGSKKKMDKAAKQGEEKKMKRQLSKLKLKQQKAAEKKAAETAPYAADVASDKPTASEPTRPKKETKSASADNDDEEAKVVFSKFDFLVKDKKSKYGLKQKVTNAEKREKFTGQNYKNLLTKLEKREEKISKLKEADPEKAFEMQDDIAWNRVLKKAEGVKVKDNKDLLKKGIKRKEKLKEKRLDKWDSRVKKVEHDKEKAQNKRTENLQKRKDTKKKAKMDKMRKKGRVL